MTIDNEQIKLELENKSSLYKLGFIDGVNSAEKYLKFDMFDFAEWCCLNNVQFVREFAEYQVKGSTVVFTPDEIIDEYFKSKSK